MARAPPVHLLLLVCLSAAASCALAAKPLLPAPQLSATTAAARTTPAAPPTCPPPGFDSLPDFDLADFVAAGPWYAAEQNEVFYQPKSALFCVRAAYLPRDAADLGKGLRVINTANRGSVSGPLIGSAGEGLFDGLLAFPDASAAPARTAASKLRVLPTFLEPTFKIKPSSPLISGPYWVVASSGPTLRQQPGAWAVVSGGAPNNRGASGDTCRTGRPGPQTFLDINGSGLWLFVRDARDARAGGAGAGAVAAAREAAANLGFDTSTLLPVAHEGCAYPPLA